MHQCTLELVLDRSTTTSFIEIANDKPITINTITGNQTMNNVNSADSSNVTLADIEFAADAIMRFDCKWEVTFMLDSNFDVVVSLHMFINTLGDGSDYFTHDFLLTGELKTGFAALIREGDARRVVLFLLSKCNPREWLLHQLSMRLSSCDLSATEVETLAKRLGGGVNYNVCFEDITVDMEIDEVSEMNQSKSAFWDSVFEIVDGRMLRLNQETGDLSVNADGRDWDGIGERLSMAGIEYVPDNEYTDQGGNLCYFGFLIYPTDCQLAEINRVKRLHHRFSSSMWWGEWPQTPPCG